MLRVFDSDRFKKDFSASFSWQDYAPELEKVREIIEAVRANGDRALREYISRFDGADLNSLTVSEDEEREAAQSVDPELKQAIADALDNIKHYHSMQMPQAFWSKGEGTVVGQFYRPLEKAGIYVPGGTAAYPSSVLMTTVPAAVAGVRDIYICTPTASDGTVNPVTLYTARQAGVKKIYKVGGAQAVAALAYGTETVPRVDKIVGPGNIYVTLAKKEVFGDVGIDMLAGPSEIMIVADDDSYADYVAADLLSQAEHDPSSKVYLVTPSQDFARKVEDELEKQLPHLSRKDTAELSLREQGGIIISSGIDEVWEIVNLVAPEHLEVHLKDPWSYLEKINNAGSVFFGPYSPEALGDYWAGTNHVLPTGRAARYSSPLGVHDFMKYSQAMSYSPEALHKAVPGINSLAMAEGLDAHALSVQIRRNG